MKRSFKKIKKTRLFFIVAVFAQLASYFASLTMLCKKQKDSANAFATLGLFATICSIALWKQDSDGIVPEKIRKKVAEKKKKPTPCEEKEEIVLEELSDEEIEKLLSDTQFDDEEDFEGLDGAFEDLKNAVEKLSEQENTDDEKEEQ